MFSSLCFVFFVLYVCFVSLVLFSFACFVYLQRISRYSVVNTEHTVGRFNSAFSFGFRISRRAASRYLAFSLLNCSSTYSYCITEVQQYQASFFIPRSVQLPDRNLDLSNCESPKTCETHRETVTTLCCCFCFLFGVFKGKKTTLHWKLHNLGRHLTAWISKL